MTSKGLIKGVIALVIIVIGVAVGWAVATNTNPNNNTNSGTPVAANATTANTPIPTFTAGAAGGQGANGGAAGGGTGGQAANGQGGTGAGRQAPVGGGTGGQAPAGGATGGQGGFQRMQPVSGTIDTYDATNSVITLKTTSGSSEQFAVGNARITKSQKVSAADFGKLTSSNIIIVSGTKNSDGSYAAQTLTAIDASTTISGTRGGFGGGAANGTPGAGTGRGGANGTPGAGFGGANGGTPRAGRTPGAGGSGGFGGAGAGGFGGAGFGGNGGVIVRNGTLNGQTLTGTDATGAQITVTLSDSTIIQQQVPGTSDDLKAGTNVTVTAAPAQNGGTANAFLIAIN